MNIRGARLCPVPGKQKGLNRFYDRAGGKKWVYVQEVLWMFFVGYITSKAPADAFIWGTIALGTFYFAANVTQKILWRDSGTAD